MKSSPLIKWIALILIGAIGFGAVRLYYHLTDDFRLANMTYELDFEAPWDIHSVSNDERDQLATILQQKYYYIGKGAQSYAFASADQQYVLKFFKFKHLKPNWLVNFVPPITPFNHYKELYIQRKRNKLIGVFEGYDLAYRENRQAAELLYLHLRPTNFLHQQVTLVDKMGFEHHVNLDDVVFMVQKKGETLRSHLASLLDRGDIEGAKQAISSILVMYMQEYQKGVYDRDHGVMHNTGFVGNKAFHLDVGKLTKDDRIKLKKFYKKDLEQISWKMDEWLKKAYPNDYPTLLTHLKNEYEYLIGEPFDPSRIDPKSYRKNRHSLVWGDE